MTPATEKESRVTDWRQDKIISTVKKDIQKNREALAEVRQRLTMCRNVRVEGEPKLDQLRADQLLNGQATSKQYESLERAIMDAKTQIVVLERDERVLLENHEHLSGVLTQAEARAKNAARAHLHSASREKWKQLKALVLQAQEVNEDLIAIESEISAEGLGEGGDKEFILFARNGASWNALSPLPIRSKVVTHSGTWLAHTDQLFGE